MNYRRYTFLRFLLLMFVSTGIFISSFHAHSDLEWNHTNTSCQTGTHLTDHTDLCPVCGFRLKAAFTANSAFEAFETVSEAVIPDSESQKHHLFTGQTTGRSPPALI